MRSSQSMLRTSHSLGGWDNSLQGDAAPEVELGDLDESGSHVAQILKDWGLRSATQTWVWFTIVSVNPIKATSGYGRHFAKWRYWLGDSPHVCGYQDAPKDSSCQRGPSQHAA